MKKYYAVLIVMMMLALVGCERYNYYYVLSDEMVKEYYPYNIGDSIVFLNESYDTTVFVVDDYFSYVESKFPKNCDCAGYAQYGFELHGNQGFDIKTVAESSSLDANDGNNTFSVFFEFLEISEQHCCFVYGNNEDCWNRLGDTVTFTADIETIMQDVVVVKNEGLFSFYDNERNCIWRLIEQK